MYVVDVNWRDLQRLWTQVALVWSEVQRRLALVEGLCAKVLMVVWRLTVEIIGLDVGQLLDFRLQISFKF